MGDFAVAVARLGETAEGLGPALDGAGFVASGTQRDQVMSEDFEQAAVQPFGVARRAADDRLGVGMRSSA